MSIVSSYGTDDQGALAHIIRYVLPNSLLNSLALTAGVCLLAGAIGVTLAWLTVSCEFPLRSFFAWVLFLPLAVPGYVMAFAFVGLFEYGGSLHGLLRHYRADSGWLLNVYSYGAIVLVLALVLYPYVYLLARNAFQTLGQRSIEVGQSLGLSVRQSFFKVALPMARPWIAGGILLVAMETLADFGTVAVFNYDTLTTAIYQAWFSLFSLSAALKIAGILLLLVVVVTVLERHSRRQRQYAEGRNAARNTKRLQLGFGAQTAALLFCSLIFMLAFVLPLGQLLYWALPNLSQELTVRFWSYVSGTVLLATLAMFVVVSMAVALAFIARQKKGLVVTSAVRLATLGYALPGTVLAIGIFVPIGYVDHWLQSKGLSSGLLQGSLLVMMMAYSVRFLAVAYTPLENNLLRVTPSIDLASQSLGVAGMAMLRRVHLPLLGPGIVTAMVLVFVDVMKELPITLMTRPFGFNTLAVRVFELTSEGMWERAALPALAIVVVGFLPVYLLIRSTEVSPSVRASK